MCNKNSTIVNINNQNLLKADKKSKIFKLFLALTDIYFLRFKI